MASLPQGKFVKEGTEMEVYLPPLHYFPFTFSPPNFWDFQDCLLLAVEDPVEAVGSGAATLNALLSVGEHLSAKKGFSVLNSDVFQVNRKWTSNFGRKNNCLRTSPRIEIDAWTHLKIRPLYLYLYPLILSLFLFPNALRESTC